MKPLITLMLLASVCALVMAVAPPPVVVAAEAPELQATLAAAGLPALPVGSLEELAAMTPKEYRRLTGERLSLRETIALKVAQKKLRKHLRRDQEERGEIPVPKGVFIILAILVPIGAVVMMGVADDWEGSRWWVALLLYVLCYFPGLIYTLTTINDYTYDE